MITFWVPTLACVCGIMACDTFCKLVWMKRLLAWPLKQRLPGRPYSNQHMNHSSASSSASSSTSNSSSNLELTNEFSSFFYVVGNDPESSGVVYRHGVVDEVDIVIAAMARWFRCIPCVFRLLKFLLEPRPEDGHDLVLSVYAGPDPPSHLCCCLTLEVLRQPVRSKYVVALAHWRIGALAMLCVARLCLVGIRFSSC